MQPNPLFLAIVAVLSLATLLALFRRHIGGQPLLAYEGRQRVPWGPWGTTLALIMVFAQLTAALLLEGPIIDADTTSAKFIQQMWISSIFIICFVLLGMAWLHWVSNASSSDLGLPTGAAQQHSSGRRVIQKGFSLRGCRSRYCRGGATKKAREVVQE